MSSVIQRIDKSALSISTIEVWNIIHLWCDTSGMNTDDEIVFVFDFQEQPYIWQDLWYFKDDTALKTLFPVGALWQNAKVLSTGTIWIWNWTQRENSKINIDGTCTLYMKTLFEYLKNPERIDASWQVRITWAVTVTGTITTVTTVTTVTWLTNIGGVSGAYAWDNWNDTAWATLVRPLII